MAVAFVERADARCAKAIDGDIATEPCSEPARQPAFRKVGWPRGGRRGFNQGGPKFDGAVDVVDRSRTETGHVDVDAALGKAEDQRDAADDVVAAAGAGDQYGFGVGQSVVDKLRDHIY